MDTITLNNGVKMPMLGFGTFQITDSSACEKNVIDAIDAGYRLIDTAQCYGNEEYVGNAIEKCSVPRSELFITTKAWFHSYESGVCRQSIIESMKKLKTDYLDLVLLHWPFGNIYSAWRDLEALYKEGKIRAIGVSNFNPDRFIDLISFNEIKPAINQIETHLYCQRKTAHKWEDKYGIAHQAYAPLGQARANEMFDEPAVKQLAEKYGKTPAQILLRFLIQNNIVVIPKSVHKNRIIENIDVFDFKLTAQELSELEKLDKNAPMIGTPETPEKVETAMSW